MSQNLTSSAKVIFAGCARDCEPFLNKVLENIARLDQYFAETAYVFIENDSVDKTKQILKEWGSNRPNFYLLNLDGLENISARTLRLEFARNTYIEAIRSTPRLRDFDYLIVLDLDDANTALTDPSVVLSAIEFLKSDVRHAAIFGNQLGTYFDMWALRHDQICPSDVWEEVLDYVLRNQASDEEAFRQTFAKRVFSLSPTEKLVEVNSAFGGIGIYKMPFVMPNPNPYLGYKAKVTISASGSAHAFRFQICEHVHFNQGIRNLGGRLFIAPSLINSSNQGITISCTGYRNMIF